MAAMQINDYEFIKKKNTVPLFWPKADLESHPHAHFAHSACVSVRQRQEQLMCFPLLIKSNAYITESSCHYFTAAWLLEAPKIDQQHQRLHKYVKTVACFRGFGFLNHSASAWPQQGTVRVNKVNKSWWPGFVGTRSYNPQHAYTQSEPRPSMEAKDSFKTAPPARLSCLLSPGECETCVTSI